MLDILTQPAPLGPIDQLKDRRTEEARETRDNAYFQRAGGSYRGLRCAPGN